MTRPRHDDAVRAVDRAAALLLALGETVGSARVTDLSRRLGLHKSTVSRLLATLLARGLVERDDETGRYRLGLAVIRLAERAERNLDVGRIAAPELERLARLTREGVVLAVLGGDQAVVIARAGGAPAVAVREHLPLHGTAAGKVLLATWAEREVFRLVRAGLPRYTPRTITELEPLLEELARVRRRGFATAVEEVGPGVGEVAVPVRDARGRVVAAVELWGSALQLGPRRLPEVLPHLQATAAAVSARLGASPAA